MYEILGGGYFWEGGCFAQVFGGLGLTIYKRSEIIK
jgi:hypothetical protein